VHIEGNKKGSGGKMSELRDSETGKELTSGQKIANAILGANKHKPISPIGETVRTDAPTNEEIGGSNYPEKSPIGEAVMTEPNIKAWASWGIKASPVAKKAITQTLRIEQDAHTRREVAKELKQFKLPVKAFFSQPMQEQWDALIRRLERK
jgi:hypothetical protein